MQVSQIIYKDDFPQGFPLVTIV